MRIEGHVIGISAVIGLRFVEQYKVFITCDAIIYIGMSVIT